MTPEERAKQIDDAYANVMKSLAPVHPDLAVKIYLKMVADGIRDAVNDYKRVAVALANVLDGSVEHSGACYSECLCEACENVMLWAREELGKLLDERPTIGTMDERHKTSGTGEATS